jgi:hypothetical protein
MEEKKGFDFGAFAQTAAKVITSPAAFFREMPKTGGYAEPLLFMVVMGVVNGLVTAVLGLFGLTFIFSMGMAIASIIIYPVMYAVFGFIGAAIVYVIWKLMGSQENYETAYRCVAYIAAFMPIVSIIDIIPYIGVLAGIAILTWVYVVASVETHKLPSQKAWLVFGILGAAIFLMSLGAGMASRSMQSGTEQRIKEMQKSTEDMKKKLEEMQKEMEKK